MFLQFIKIYYIFINNKSTAQKYLTITLSLTSTLKSHSVIVNNILKLKSIKIKLQLPMEPVLPHTDLYTKLYLYYKYIFQNHNH